MANLRAAKLTVEILQSYSVRLARENVEDVVAALGIIAERPRKEGETALPDIGTILAEVKAQGRIREAKERKQHSKHLAHLVCPGCKTSCAGWVRLGDNLKFYCRRCGMLMVEDGTPIVPHFTIQPSPNQKP
jgi:hypothetical protein